MHGMASAFWHLDLGWGFELFLVLGFHGVHGARETLYRRRGKGIWAISRLLASFAYNGDERVGKRDNRVWDELGQDRWLRRDGEGRNSSTTECEGFAQQATRPLPRQSPTTKRQVVNPNTF